ncbi:MAG: CAAX prenyl protease-related protein [Verrucomicrobia bacterium]|nr:CAAX prenyl protease-related protein [Verrucomicrobiota bacterium]
MIPFVKSPTAVRVAPFLIFVGLTFCQGWSGGVGLYWLYLLKTLVGALLIWRLRPVITEMRWAFSWPAIAVGVGVFAIWVGLDPFYPRWSKGSAAWNPLAEFGPGSAAASGFILVRVVGSTLVVPPLEEVFYRSFLYRYAARPRFEEVALGEWRWFPFVVTSVIFGFAHFEWLAGILAGVGYQGLVCGKKRLGDAMTAHAVTNLLLGLWVVGRGAWHFW